MTLRPPVLVSIKVIGFLLFLIPLFSRASPALSPREEILDVRDAPTAGVFALMFQRVYVSRDLPPFVTLRLTGKQIPLPPPSNGRESYGDFLPVGGWLKAVETALKAGPLLVGFEREGGYFYLSLNNGNLSSGADQYDDDAFGPAVRWHKLSGGKSSSDAAGPASPASGTPLSRCRLAGIRWTREAVTRKALLVVRTENGDAFARVAAEGASLGLSNLIVEKIDANSVTLRGPGNGEGSTGEHFRLLLRASR